MYEALCGMQETIKKDRPVLSLAIYHNPQEFFECKPLLEKYTENLNYKITINCHHPFYDCNNGVILFAYPQELGDDNFLKYE